MSGTKRKQEERTVATLRELASMPNNKQCFDCAQRGPTYVNMTIGSFVCTSCSGLLRGLNPPHRVKSISMATFTPDEIEFLKARGNDYCTRIWLGLYDGDPKTMNGTYKDDSHMKDFLMNKYEKKRWFVSPSEVSRQQVLLDQTTKTQSQTQQNVGDNRPRSTSTASNISTQSAGRIPPLQQHQQQQHTKPSNSLLDLESPRAQPVQDGGFAFSTNDGGGNGGGNFADFANFNQHAGPPAHAGGNPFGEMGFGAMSKSVTMPAGITAPPPISMPISIGHPPPGSGVMQPTGKQLQQQQNHTPQPPAQNVGTGNDKYSALSELDDLFRVPSKPPTPPPQSVFGSQAGGTMGGIFGSGGGGGNIPKSQSAFGNIGGGGFGQAQTHPPAAAATTAGNPFLTSAQSAAPPTQFTQHAPIGQGNPFLSGGPGPEHHSFGHHQAGGFGVQQAGGMPGMGQAWGHHQHHQQFQVQPPHAQQWLPMPSNQQNIGGAMTPMSASFQFPPVQQHSMGMHQQPVGGSLGPMGTNPFASPQQQPQPRPVNQWNPFN